MAKKIIENGDVVFATGVHLRRDTKNNGGWVVESFEDDTYFDGKVVNSNQTSDSTVEYFTGDNE
jgi:hypothetical protein